MRSPGGADDLGKGSVGAVEQEKDLALLLRIRAALMHVVAAHSCSDGKSVDAVGVAAHLVLDIDRTLGLETPVIEKLPRGTRH